MKPNNEHSSNVFALLQNYGGGADILAWNIYNWNPFNENIVNFCVHKLHFTGTISIESRGEMFVLAYCGLAWKESKFIALKGSQLAEFISKLGVPEYKRTWSSGESREEVKGERAPQ